MSLLIFKDPEYADVDLSKRLALCASRNAVPVRYCIKGHDCKVTVEAIIYTTLNFVLLCMPEHELCVHGAYFLLNGITGAVEGQVHTSSGGINACDELEVMMTSCLKAHEDTNATTTRDEILAKDKGVH
ncbi:MAG: hypothetical protein V3S69_02575 [Dehalococcoidales bacterium]